MGPLLLEIAPLALGIAASPFPVVPAILLNSGAVMAVVLVVLGVLLVVEGLRGVS